MRLTHGHTCRDDGGDGEHDQRDPRRPCNASRAPMLTHILAVEFVLRPPVQRRRQVEHHGAKLGMAQRKFFGAPGPAEIDVQRLAFELA